MVSDEMSFLKGEETKLKEILSESPDSVWARDELSRTQTKIKKLKAKEERD